MQVQFLQESPHLNLDVQYCMDEKFVEAVCHYQPIYEGVDRKAFQHN